MKVVREGDYIYCKKTMAIGQNNLIAFKQHKYYEVKMSRYLYYPYEVATVIDDNGAGWRVDSVYNDFFYTKSDLRKSKLKQAVNEKI